MPTLADVLHFDTSNIPLNSIHKCRKKCANFSTLSLWIDKIIFKPHIPQIIGCILFTKFHFIILIMLHQYVYKTSNYFSKSWKDINFCIGDKFEVRCGLIQFPVNIVNGLFVGSIIPTCVCVCTCMDYGKRRQYKIGKREHRSITKQNSRWPFS